MPIVHLPNGIGFVSYQAGQTHTMQLHDGSFFLTGLTPPATVAGAKNLRGVARSRSSAIAKASKVSQLGAQLSASATGTMLSLHNGRTELAASLSAASLLPRVAIPSGGGVADWPTYSRIGYPSNIPNTTAFFRQYPYKMGTVGADTYLKTASYSPSYTSMYDTVMGPADSTVFTPIYSALGYTGGVVLPGGLDWADMTFRQSDGARFAIVVSSGKVHVCNMETSTYITPTTIHGTAVVSQAILYVQDANNIAVIASVPYTAQGKDYNSLWIYKSTNGGTSFVATLLIQRPLGTGVENSSTIIHLARAHPTLTNRVYLHVDHTNITAGGTQVEKLYYLDLTDLSFGETTLSGLTLLSGGIRPYWMRGQTMPHAGCASGVFFHTYLSINPGGGTSPQPCFLSASFDLTSTTAWKTPAWSSAGPISLYTTYSIYGDGYGPVMFRRRSSDGGLDVFHVAGKDSSTFNLRWFKYDLTAKTGTYTTTLYTGVWTSYSDYGQQGMQWPTLDDEPMGAIQEVVSSTGVGAFKLSWVAQDVLNVHITGTLTVASTLSVDLTVPTSNVPIDMALLSASSAALDLTIGSSVSLDSTLHAVATAALFELTVGGIQLGGHAYALCTAELSLRAGTTPLDATGIARAHAMCTLGVLHSSVIAAGVQAAASAVLGLRRGVPLSGDGSSTASAYLAAYVVTTLSGKSVSTASAHLELRREVQLSAILLSVSTATERLRAAPKRNGWATVAVRTYDGVYTVRPEGETICVTR